MTDDKEKDSLMSLVAQSTDRLSIRSSMVSRGLRELSEHVRGDTVQAAFDAFRQGHIEEAIKLCDAGLEMSPTDEALWQIKGVCLAKQSRHAEGLTYMDRALAADPENPHCWALKCSILRSLNRTDEELECWRRVLRISGDYQGAWRQIGCCLLYLGRFSEAIEAFDSELNLNPLDAICLSQRDTARLELRRELTRRMQDMLGHLRGSS